MEALIPIVTMLAEYAPMLAKLAPGIETASKIGTAIQVVGKIAPLVIQEATDLVPTIKNVITTLRGAGGTTDEQLDRLDVIEKQIDADYDMALAAAEAQDNAS